MEKLKVPFNEQDVQKYLNAGVPESLDAFLKELTTTYEPDYGSVCLMMGLFATVAANKFNETPLGGITGTQAHGAMWEFIRNFMIYEGPMKLVRFEQMAFPQYEAAFEKVISADTFKYLQDYCKQKLATSRPVAAPVVIRHWESIVQGEVPFGYKIKD